MPLPKSRTFLLSCAILLVTLAHTSPVDPKSVPVIDGAIGPCSADFTITDPSGSPVYAANIKVHIAYGFMYARKLDLEVGTNSDGKARFIGLPDRTKQGLFFRASVANREGSAFVDPAKTCTSTLAITLQDKPQ
ncbi:MAG: hypothetical protein WAN65_25965 [Candidatus Sulfotelmatobacter sp.]